MAVQSPAIYVGTRAGLMRWQDGLVVTLVRGAEAVTAITRIPGGRFLAGTTAGSLLRSQRDGANWSACHAPAAGAITSILHPAGAGKLVLAGTTTGHLLESHDEGATFSRPAWGPPLQRAPILLAGISGTPRALLVLHVGRGIWRSAAVGAPFEAWRPADAMPPIAKIASHAVEGQIWLALTERRVVRSTDGARTFNPVAGLPESVRPRELHFASAAKEHAFLITHPPPLPPDPDDPSCVWMSSDAGLTFHPIPSRLLDRARDPSGEFTAISTHRVHHGLAVVLGTDRGELLEWRGGDEPAMLLVDDLPPIETLLSLSAATPLDPTSSGVYLLP